MGTGVLSRSVKRQGGEVNHSPPTRAKKKGIYTSTPPYAFILVKRGGKVIILLFLCSSHDGNYKCTNGNLENQIKNAFFLNMYNLLGYNAA
jgi:hypothetical protein